MSEKPETGRSSIDEIADAWVETSARLNPSLAIRLGRKSLGFADYSSDGVAELVEAARASRRQLESAVAVDRQDEVTRRDLVRELTQFEVEHDAGLVVGMLNVIESPAQEIRNVFDLLPRATERDWHAIAVQLREVRGALESYARGLAERVGRSLSSPVQRSQSVAVAAQARQAAAAFFPAIAAEAAAHPQLPESLRQDVAELVSSAGESFSSFARFLDEVVTPRATPIDSVGADVYAIGSRHFLGTSIDLDEHYEWGIKLLAEVTEQQRDTAALICGERSVPEAISALDADDSRMITGTTALQEWLQRTSDEAVAALAGVHFDIDDELSTLSCRIAPSQDGGIYYTAPSLDASRPGTMWWSVPPGIDTFRVWREKTTVYHEGVPGHHLQMGGSALNNRLCDWRRAVAGTSGHREGWALYAEEVMQELGFISEPGELLGALDAQRMRAARVVVDIGLHTGKRRPDGGTWDSESAFEFMSKNTVMSAPSLRYEVLRYIGWPGQAASYSIGKRAWQKARKRHLSLPGTSLREFHRKALSYGGLGLDTFEWAMNESGGTV